MNYKEIISDEIKKCFISPEYFCKKYCYIINQESGRVLFDLYTFQESTLNYFKKTNELIILKSRQLGISTLSAAFSLWFVLFNSGKYVLFVSKRQKDAVGLIDKVHIMYKYLPIWFKSVRPKPINDNKMSIEFNNESKISAESTTKDTGRSTSNALVILDEFAFIREADNLFASLYQTTISSGGKFFVISTPNGIGNKFHKIWTSSISGDNNFTPIRLKWDVHPKHDLEWREQQTIELGTRLASQECDADFLSSGNVVIDPNIIKKIEQEFVSEPIKKIGYARNLWVWELPVPGRSYLISVDVARGDGTDFSAFHVIDIEDSKQVAEFKGQIDTRELAKLLVSSGMEYNYALLIIENANIGWDVVQEVISTNYPNIYYSDKSLFVNPQKLIKNQYDLYNLSKVPGWITSTKTRPLLISNLEHYINESAVIIKSQRTVDELYVFSWINGKPQSSPGYNDDLVISLSIGLFVRNTFSRLNKHGLELTKSALDSICSSISTGIVEENDKKKEEIFTMSNKIGGREKIDWLLDVPVLK